MWQNGADIFRIYSEYFLEFFLNRTIFEYRVSHVCARYLMENTCYFDEIQIQWKIDVRYIGKICMMIETDACTLEIQF